MCQAESDLGGEELQLRLEAVAVAWLEIFQSLLCHAFSSNICITFTHRGRITSAMFFQLGDLVNGLESLLLFKCEHVQLLSLVA